MIKLEKIFVLLFLLGLSVRMSAVGLDKRFQILPLPQQMEIQKGKGISAGELSFVTMKGEGEIPVLGNMLDALPRYAVKGVKGVTLSMTEKDVPVSPEGIGSLFQRNCHPCPFSGRTVLWLPDLGAADGRQPTVFIGGTGDENYGLSGYSLSRCTSGYKTSFGPDGILLSHD